MVSVLIVTLTAQTSVQTNVRAAAGGCVIIVAILLVLVVAINR